MNVVWLIVGIGLLLSPCGSMPFPSDFPPDAKVIELDQKVVDSAPGADYRVRVPSTGTL